MTSDGRVIGDIEMWLARWLAPSEGSAHHAIQRTTCADCQRQAPFVELQFLVKSFDVGYTLENVNGVGILGNGAMAAHVKKEHNEVTCRLIFNRSRRAPFPIPFGLIDDHPAKTING